MEFMNILRYFYPYVSMWLPTLMTNQQQWNQKQTNNTQIIVLKEPRHNNLCNNSNFENFQNYQYLLHDILNRGILTNYNLQHVPSGRCFTTLNTLLLYSSKKSGCDKNATKSSMISPMDNGEGKCLIYILL